MAARAKKTADAPEVQWAYGLRTWSKDGRSYGGFKWDLEIGARTVAPDWNSRAECGRGLHCNPFGCGDWSLMGCLSEVVAGTKVLGVVRYDAALAVDLNGKIKAPWMEVVLTTATADIGSVLGFLSPHRIKHIQGLTKVQKDAKATTGTRSAAATTGDGSAAATTGDGSAAATTGYGSIAAAIGIGSTAKAGPKGAIMLAAYGDYDGKGYPLKAVFAGVIGKKYGKVMLKPNVAYSLGTDGVPVEAAS